MMANYKLNTNRAIRQFARTPEGKKFVHNAMAIVSDASALMASTRKRSHEMANDGGQYLKNEGHRRFHKIAGLKPPRRHTDARTVLFAAGAGALLSYFLIPRK